MPFQEDFYEFETRHNSEHVRDQQGFLRFRDGSVWVPASPSDPVHGTGHEPPEDPDELREHRLAYHELRLEQKSRDFHALKSALAAQTEIAALGAGPLPDDVGFDILESLKNDVEREQRSLDALKPKRVARPRRQSLREQQAPAVAAFRSSLDRINL